MPNIPLPRKTTLDLEASSEEISISMSGEQEVLLTVGCEDTMLTALTAQDCRDFATTLLAYAEHLEAGAQE